MPCMPPTQQHARGPLPPWVGSWLVCLCRSLCAGDSPARVRCALVASLAQGHTWFSCPGVTGTRAGVFSPPAGPPQKPPISPCPPILCWLGELVPPLSSDASLVAILWGMDTLGSSLGRLMRGGRAGTCMFPPHSPSAPRGFTPPAQEPCQPWEHSASGCQLVLLQDPVLGLVTC